MRIGIMLRSLHYRGGIATYTQEITKHIVELDRSNEYVLFYPAFEDARKSVGQFAHLDHVTEVLSRSPIPIGHYWDHVTVPRAARKWGIDLLFNPFISIPLFGPFKKVFVMHNCEWHIMPEVFWPTERLIGRWRVDACMRSADRVISVSRKVADELIAATGLPEDKFRIVHNAPGDRFHPIHDDAVLRSVAEKYDLPEDFLLFAGGIYPQKNFGTLLRAFHALRDEIPHRLVVAGMMRWKTGSDERLLRELDMGDRVQLVGWVGHEDLAAMYNLATCFVIPSYFESCSVALLEALACGCPIIASDAGGNPEVVGDAAILHNPDDQDALEAAILRVARDPELRKDLSARGLQRSERFGWEKAARETLAVFRELAPSPARSDETAFAG